MILVFQPCEYIIKVWIFSTFTMGTTFYGFSYCIHEINLYHKTDCKTLEQTMKEAFDV